MPKGGKVDFSSLCDVKIFLHNSELWNVKKKDSKN